MGSNPYARIERTCSPVAWLGSIGVSVSRMSSPGAEAIIAETMDSMDSGCQQVVWNLMYGADYNAVMRNQAAQQAAEALKQLNLFPLENNNAPVAPNKNYQLPEPTRQQSADLPPLPQQQNLPPQPAAPSQNNGTPYYGNDAGQAPVEQPRQTQQQISQQQAYQQKMYLQQQQQQQQQMLQQPPAHSNAAVKRYYPEPGVNRASRAYYQD